MLFFCYSYLMSEPSKLHCTVKQYRPNVERQKWLYSMKQSRDYIRRLQGKPPEDSGIKSGPRIKDNSEPWLPGGVRSIADAIWISDQIKQTKEKWGTPIKPEN